MAREIGRTQFGFDPGTTAFIEQLRNRGIQGANTALSGMGAESFFTGPFQQTPGEMAQPFFNPFQQNVIGGIRGEFDFLRDQASNQTAQQATAANSFGGSRQAVLEGTRLGELDRAQTSQIGNLLFQGFDRAQGRGLDFAERQRQLKQQQLMEPLFRQRQALQFMQGGLGPIGQTQQEFVNRGIGDRAKGALGGAATGAAIGSVIPGLGTGIGAGIGGLIGLL